MIQALLQIPVVNLPGSEDKVEVVLCRASGERTTAKQGSRCRLEIQNMRLDVRECAHLLNTIDPSWRDLDVLQKPEPGERVGVFANGQPREGVLREFSDEDSQHAHVG